VLDTCAAPGGKTIVIAADMGGSGLLVSADYRPARVRLLKALTTAAGVRARIVALDLTRGLPFDAIFDRVLVDAPCSGLGTVRRDPDLKWSRTAADLPRFARVQGQMLTQAARAVRPGGRLIYATCSSESEENDDVVRAFLQGQPEFAVERADPGPLVPDGGQLVEDTGFLRTLPYRDGLEAFFAATLVRREAA
jgi:16S rRNA (cytosine967-C5)-methyltransferase